MKYALVTTTIFIPKLLEKYCENFKNNGYEDIELIVIGDNKTPFEVSSYCKELGKKFGYGVGYWDVEAQKKWLKNYPALNEYLPWDSIERRIIGYIIAYNNGNDVIISIDDDNFVVDRNYLETISHLGKGKEVETTRSSTGWYNICKELQTDDNRIFYPRGFPFSEKWKNEELTIKKANGKLVVQAGMWLLDPDIDAVTRLEKPINVLSVSKKIMDGVYLGKDTFCPFNTQNTALHRSTIPAWFVSPTLDRYSDIWGSYVLTKISHHLEDLICFGRPLVRQDRNEHNLFKDLNSEVFGMRNTDYFMKLLMNIRLTKSTYIECFKEIIEGLRNSYSKNQFIFDGDYKIFDDYLNGMKIWYNIFKDK